MRFICCDMFFVFLSAFCFLSMTKAIEASSSIQSLGVEISLQSKVLNEERTFMVYLPPNYHSTHYYPKHYPVLYVLDGETRFLGAASVVNELSQRDNSAVPEMIVVGIKNTNRNRDMTPSFSLKGFYQNINQDYKNTGGADAFLAFLEKELIPYINAHYRSAPYKIIAGHSLSGLTSMYALIMNPSLFDAYLAFDPSFWWDDQFISKRMRKSLGSYNLDKKTLIVTTASFSSLDVFNRLSNKPANDHLKMAKNYQRQIENQQQSLLKSDFIHFEDETHASVPMLSFYHSFKRLFKGYELSLTLQYDKPENIIEHYSELSKEFGFLLYPNEDVIDARGCEFLRLPILNIDKAITLFKVNTTHFPKSFHAWHSLGEAYLAKGDRQVALKYFLKAYQLNPNFSYSLNRIKEIRKTST